MHRNNSDGHADKGRRAHGRETYRVGGRADEGDSLGSAWAGWNADKAHKKAKRARSDGREAVRAADRADYRAAHHARSRHDHADRGGRSAAGTIALVGLLGAAAYAVAPHVRRLLAEQGIGTKDSEGHDAKDVSATITIARPASELYDRWRSYERFDQFMPDVISVRPVDDGQESDWTVRGPGGQELRFRACLTEDVPGRTIAWKSDDKPASHSGRVTFTEKGADSSEVQLELHMEPPGGVLGAIAARLLGKASGTDPQMEAERALRNFKRVVERDGAGGSSGAAWQTASRSSDDDELESQVGATSTGGVNGSSTGQPYNA